MSNQASYQPPFTLTPAILRLVAEVAEAIGRLTAQGETVQGLRLRRIHRIRTIQGSLAIEGNTLSEEQINAISSAATPKSHLKSPPKLNGSCKHLLARCPARLERQ